MLTPLPTATLSKSPADNIILIVDDNPNNLSVLAETLKYANHQVRIAMDGESALKQIALNRPALILLDVMMPGIDGFETCKQIQANPEFSDIPIIFMSALSNNDAKVEGLSIGAVDYISKPFQDVEVLSRVEIHLKRSELIRSLQIRNQQLAEEIDKRQVSEALNRKLESCIEVSTAVLSEASEHFHQAQMQLANSEKLSTLGELVAGVAHEINNPIGCITNNVEFVGEHGQLLLNHIACYQKVLAANKDKIAPADLEKIAQHEKEIDLGYITEDFPDLIESMVTSGERIQAISQSLRTFARADTTERQPYSLHEGIDSTLLILRHRLKGEGNQEGITLTKYYGDLPDIYCFPGQINQVFMNILANAIDAMEAGEDPSGPPEIIITTQTTEDAVIIAIEDNAGGMPEHVRTRVFESQFTTKTVGKGTGLGLSIAHQIVTETHQGKIECESTLGQGTTFKITLPIDSY
ncbi:MAG: response regulator [Cyanobacteria bacterium J06614_10]